MRDVRRSALTCLSAGAALVALVAVVSTASAGGRVLIRSAEEGIALEDTGSATAHCLAGERIVSGGFDSPGFNPLGGPQSYTFSSHRVAGQSWIAGAQDQLLAGSVVSFAYCRAGRALAARSASVSVPGPAGTVRSATATCKPGRKVVSGGFDNPDFGTGGLFIFRSSRSGRRAWTVSGVNGRNSANTLVAYAYCRRGGSLKTSSGTADVPPGNTQTGTASATCKPGQRVLAGGFSNPTEDWSDVGSDLFYYSSHRIGKRGWTASAINFGNTAGTLTAYAYCEPR